MRRLLLLHLFIATVASLVTSCGFFAVDNPPDKNYAAFCFGLRQVSADQFQIGKIKPGPIQWKGTFGHIQEDGTVRISLNPQIRPGFALKFQAKNPEDWKGLASGDKIRFRGNLKFGRTLLVYLGNEGLPSAFLTVSNDLPIENGKILFPGYNAKPYGLRHRTELQIIVSDLEPIAADGD
ncbi:MAG: hypothetical protein GXY83_12460 [Rhodopirellula sp.]|nr:hypothetical protein [Rhodopirellula sp.]